MLKVGKTVEGLGPETEIGEDFCRYKMYFRASLCTELITAKPVEPNRNGRLNHTQVCSAMAQLGFGLSYLI